MLQQNQAPLQSALQAPLVADEVIDLRENSIEQMMADQSKRSGLETFLVRLYLAPTGLNSPSSPPHADAILTELLYAGTSTGFLYSDYEKESLIETIADAVNGRGSVNIELTFYNDGKMTQRLVGAERKMRYDAYHAWQEAKV